MEVVCLCLRVQRNKRPVVEAGDDGPTEAEARLASGKGMLCMGSQALALGDLPLTKGSMGDQG